jgi:ELP3 family radical SAM enzyme/protein acetyltransferase
MSDDFTVQIEELPKVIQKKNIVSNEDCDIFLTELFFKLDKVQEYTPDSLDKCYGIVRSSYKIAPSKAELRNAWEKRNYTNSTINKNANSVVFKRWLIKKAMRSDSGVLVVTIVTKPGDSIKFSCPEACAFCPTETDLNGIPSQPKSYISSEPAMRRALMSNFDIRGQINDRLAAYVATGNVKMDDKKKKIEVILSGGTWDVMPLAYRSQVINEVFWGFNVYNNANEDIKDIREMKSIEEEIKENENATFSVIGLSIETRPDYITKTTIKQYLKWGVTRVQIGIQHYDDEILKKLNRGCYTKHTIQAIRLLKGVGLKIVIHLMPDLPGSSPKLDKWMFDQALTNPDLQFDDLKIYPCAVIKSHAPEYKVTSTIAEWYESGEYVPYSEQNIEDLIDVCIYYKKNVQPWVRIERLIRDIPSQSMTAGYGKVSNLRQVLVERMKKSGDSCKCIRCMEIRDKQYNNNAIKLVVRPYKASLGTEYHISVEVEDCVYHYDWIVFLIWFWLMWIVSFGKTTYQYTGSRKHYIGLLGFCKLRIDPNPGLGFVPELEGAGLIRELHVYGQTVCVGDKSESTQHRGFGQLLIKTAECIIKENGLKKSAIISGIGAREYYKNKCGYCIEGTYMTKML